MLFLFLSFGKFRFSLFKSFFLSLNFFIKAVNVLFQPADKALYAKRFFAGKLPFLNLADKIFKLPSGMNKKIMHFLLMTVF